MSDEWETELPVREGSLFVRYSHYDLDTDWALCGGCHRAHLPRLLLALRHFRPYSKVRHCQPGAVASNDSPNFLILLESMVDAKVNRTGSLEVLKNGPPSIPPSWMRSATPGAA